MLGLFSQDHQGWRVARYNADLALDLAALGVLGRAFFLGVSPSHIALPRVPKASEHLYKWGQGGLGFGPRGAGANTPVSGYDRQVYILSVPYATTLL